MRVYKSTAKVTTQYKMYNHSCDEMDRKEGQDVPVRRVFGTDLLETWLDIWSSSLLGVGWFVSSDSRV